MCRIHCFSDVHALFALTSKNTHIILSASHFSVLSRSSFSYLCLHLSFFFFTIASLSLTPAHPSYSKPARLHLFFLTSLSFLPVFQPWLFPPSFSVTPSLSRPISLTFRALLSFPLCPFFCLFCYALSAPTSFSLFLFPLLFLEYVIFHTSWHHQSSISHWPCIHPDINQLVLVS